MRYVARLRPATSTTVNLAVVRIDDDGYETVLFPIGANQADWRASREYALQYALKVKEGDEHERSIVIEEVELR
jgi:hypothetical protein